MRLTRPSSPVSSPCIICVIIRTCFLFRSPVECFYFAANPPQYVNLMHNSEQPATCFAILDSGNCLVADLQFDALMSKIKMQKKNPKVEAKGLRYEIGDFIVKVGSVLLGQSTSFKGVIVEVWVLLCFVVSFCLCSSYLLILINSASRIFTLY